MPEKILEADFTCPVCKKVTIHLTPDDKVDDLVCSCCRSDLSLKAKMLIKTLLSYNKEVEILKTYGL